MPDPKSTSPFVRTPSGLLLFSPKFRSTEEIVTLPDGKRVRVTTDDSGTVRHTEEDHALHATVRPRSVRLRLSTTSKE